ncbi:hypothetical protein Rs2_19175 [Raphanus sativus]|nr:hypothetical protein Rs2_19175 [Raphanus sativus]
MSLLTILASLTTSVLGKRATDLTALSRSHAHGFAERVSSVAAIKPLQLTSTSPARCVLPAPNQHGFELRLHLLLRGRRQSWFLCRALCFIFVPVLYSSAAAKILRRVPGIHLSSSRQALAVILHHVILIQVVSALCSALNHRSHRNRLKPGRRGSKRSSIEAQQCSTFCGSHRYPEKHEYSFDFKEVGRDVIAKANPVIKADKVERI